LFRGEGGRALAYFANWTATVVSGGAIRLILTDIFGVLHDKHKDYFRRSPEQRFGMPLAAVTKDRDSYVEDFRRDLQPLRASVTRAPYLSGDEPAWADYVAFGPFQWARSVSRFPLLKPDDPVFTWCSRMIGLFGQVATRQVLQT
jgi:hypothetical protein